MNLLIWQRRNDQRMISHGTVAKALQLTLSSIMTLSFSDSSWSRFTLLGQHSKPVETGTYRIQEYMIPMVSQ